MVFIGNGLISVNPIYSMKAKDVKQLLLLNYDPSVHTYPYTPVCYNWA